MNPWKITRLTSIKVHRVSCQRSSASKANLTDKMMICLQSATRLVWLVQRHAVSRQPSAGTAIPGGRGKGGRDEGGEKLRPMLH